MNDILPDEAARWQRLESEFRAHVALAGYGEIRTPLLEPTALFVRQVGETTDMVEKEMYSFERHGDALTVRPEGTAGAARAYVEHKVYAKEPVSRWFYWGAMFRGERPAKGRYRQFHQSGCEIYGDPGPLADAELIDLACTFFKRIGIDRTVVHLNSLGSFDTKQRYRDELLRYFEPLAPSLSEDSQRRLAKNPLRVLDSKDPKDREAAKNAPSILELLEGDEAKHWNELCHHLDVLGVRYVKDPSLVRGLDYYTRTLFEVKIEDSDLGAQNTLCAGGRYDAMIEGLGGPKTPAIGWAMGLERILLSMPEDKAANRLGCFIAPLTSDGSDRALVLAKELRALGVSAEIDGRGGKLKRMMQRADTSGARFCVILGDEVSRGIATVKDLAAHAQDEIPLDGAARTIADRIFGAPHSKLERASH